MLSLLAFAYVVRLNGKYLLYVDTSLPGSSFGGEALLASPDGINWSAPSSVTLEDAGGTKINYGPDVGGVVMPNGKLRLFSNYNFSSILFYDRITP